MKTRLFACLLALCVLSLASADVYVESRSGGKNYDSYSETGTFADSSAKSSATGTTGGIGCRYASTYFSGRIARFGFPATAEAGAYRVHITHPSSGSNKAECQASVGHDGGVDDVAYNQLINANIWTELGIYEFTPGTSYVDLSFVGTLESGTLRSDAVWFEGPMSITPTPTNTPEPLPTMTPGIGTIIVESRETGLNYDGNYLESSTWADSTDKSTADGLTAELGSRFYMMDFPNRRAKFYLPTPQVPGNYVCYVTHPGGGTAKGRWWVRDVAGIIAGETDSFDQSQNEDTWIPIGIYNLNPGQGYVEIGATSYDTDGGARFYSDAVKFVGPQPISGVEQDHWSIYE